jgi:hypothetical protein
MFKGFFTQCGVATLLLILVIATSTGCTASSPVIPSSSAEVVVPEVEATGWQEYADTDGDSSVAEYEIGEDYITILFSDGSIYTYTNASAGAANIEHMKALAIAGDGLNAFIMTNVKYDYVSKTQAAKSVIPEPQPCSACDGEGSSRCLACGGRGRTPCVACGSAGFTKCTMCGGSGLDECWQCYGSGVLSYGGTCTMCRGAGVIDCIGCTGGGFECYACNGTGASLCYLCAQTGRQECQTCGGSGLVSY